VQRTAMLNFPSQALALGRELGDDRLTASFENDSQRSCCWRELPTGAESERTVIVCALPTRMVAVVWCDQIPHMLVYELDSKTPYNHFFEELEPPSDFGPDVHTALFPFSANEFAVFTCSPRPSELDYFRVALATSCRNRKIFVYSFAKGCSGWSEVTITGEGPPDVPTRCQAIVPPSMQAAYLFLDGLSAIYKLDLRTRSWSRIKHPFTSQGAMALPFFSRAYLASEDVIGLLLPLTDGTEGYQRYHLTLSTDKWQLASRHQGGCMIRREMHAAVTSVPSNYLLMLGGSCAHPKNGGTIPLANVDMLSLAGAELPTDPPSAVSWKRPRTGGAKLPAFAVGAATYHAPSDSIWLFASGYNVRVRAPLSSCCVKLTCWQVFVLKNASKLEPGEPSRVDPLEVRVAKFLEGDVFARCSSCEDLENDTRRHSACGRCKIAKYCSLRCQKAHWPAHKGQCASREQ
jgi:hypothetical protein